MSLIKINKKFCVSEGENIDNFVKATNVDFATVKENLSIFRKSRNVFIFETI